MFLISDEEEKVIKPKIKRKREITPQNSPPKRNPPDIAKLLIQVIQHLRAATDVISKNVEKNTKFEIKEADGRIRRYMKVLTRENITTWINTVGTTPVKEKTETRKTTLEMETQTQDETTGTQQARRPNTREMGTQTGEDPVLKELPEEVTYESFKDIADKKWDQGLFQNVNVLKGNPLDTKSEVLKVVFVEEQSPDMSEGIKLLYRKRFPEIVDMGDMATLKQATRYTTDSGSRTVGQRIMKIITGDEKSVWGKMTKLTEVTAEEKYIAIHHTNGLTLETLKKMTQMIFRSRNTTEQLYTTERKIQIDETRDKGKTKTNKKGSRELTPLW